MNKLKISIIVIVFLRLLYPLLWTGLFTFTEMIEPTLGDTLFFKVLDLLTIKN